MEDVLNFCQRQTVPGTREPAHVSRVLRVPANSSDPKIFMYFGKFNKDVADKIDARKKQEVCVTNSLMLQCENADLLIIRSG